MTSLATTRDLDQSTTVSSETSLLLKVQTAGKKWEKAPEELFRLYKLLQETGYQVPWTPKKLGINLLTSNKVRGIVLKRMLMILYPFDSFWSTETLDETLHKCLMVCQQLGIEADRAMVWGHCSMNSSYSFWIELLTKVSTITKGKSEEESVQEAKSSVIAALIATRGTDWDKKIARNFEEGLGRNRVTALVSSTLMKNIAEGLPRPRHKSTFKGNNSSWRSSFQNVFDERRAEANGNNPPQPLTTFRFAGVLKQETQDMLEMLRNLEKYYSEDCVLQIDKAFEYGQKVCELAEEFEGYMNANNRGAFRDVDSLANHTDKVIKAMSRLTTAYNDFFQEFQKYFRSGRGDEITLPPFPYSTEFMERN